MKAKTHATIGLDRTIRDGNRARRMQSFVIAFERVGPIFQVRTLAVTAGLAVLAALGTLAGLRVRFRRSLPQTPVQRVAAWVQGGVAVHHQVRDARIARQGVDHGIAQFGRCDDP